MVSDITGRKLWTFHPGAASNNGGIANFIAEIRWSPNGKQLAFMMGSPVPTIYVVNADGGAMKARNALGMERELSIRSFGWSPDGRRFALRVEADSRCNITALVYKFETGHFLCIYSRNLVIVNVDGSNFSKVTRSPDYDSGDLFLIQ